MSKLLVVDGHSLAYRSFFAFPPNLTMPDGQPINAVFGFMTLLFQAYETIKPDHLCVCFDLKGPTFRKELYPDYKAHRPPAPEEFVSQMGHLKGLLGRFNIAILEKQGFEADDVMGTLSVLSNEKKMDCVLMTGDKDSFQLVSDHVCVAMPQKGSSSPKMYGPKEVEEKYDLRVDQLIDLKSLQGDTSDNIPGVPGIGEKTGVKLLKAYDTLDGIYASIDDVTPPGVKAKLEANKELAYLSRKLARIECAVPLDRPLDDLKYSPDWSEILAGFKEYDFKRLIGTYSGKVSGDVAEDVGVATVRKPDGAYSQLNTIAQVKTYLPRLSNGFAIDLETTDVDGMVAQIVGIALSTEDKEGVYIPLNDTVKDVPLNVPMFAELGGSDNTAEMTPILELLKPILEDPSVPKYAHNAKYELTVFNRYGIRVRGMAFDTMLAAFLIFPGEKVGLKDVVSTHLGIQMTTYEEVAGKGRSQIPFTDVDLDIATQYAACDADMTHRLVTFLTPKLAELGLESLFRDIEMPVMDVLFQMEVEGVCLDSDYLAGLSDEFNGEIQSLSRELYRLAGSEFNLNSPQQVAHVLFDQLNLPVIKRTKTGISTDSFVLEKLQDEHEIPKLLLRYRELEKLQNTYVKALPTLVNSHTGRIHTSFNQTVAITGRLSSTKPNLQNIPIRTDDGFKIRRAFVPSAQDRRILSVDYSQIELRLMAHLSEDESMISAFRNGEDIHSSTAALVFGVPYDQVSKEYRYRAKAVNFGIIYGSTAHGLAQNLKISRSEAKEIIDAYFEKFPKIRQFMDDTVEYAKQHDLVKTEFGRIRYIPDIHSKDRSRFGFAKRTAVNTRLQGTAADIMKLAMIRVRDAIDAAELNARMVIQVHDELVLDVPESEIDVLSALVQEHMMQVVAYRVPMEVDVEVGPNWKDVA